MVVQQDSFIEDQRQALSERSSSCTSLSRPSSRPSSLIEQEKQRSLEKQRQEMASLQRQQAAHAEEKRRREKDWEFREQRLTEREVLVHIQVPICNFLFVPRYYIVLCSYIRWCFHSNLPGTASFLMNYTVALCQEGFMQCSDCYLHKARVTGGCNDVGEVGRRFNLIITNN